MKQSHLITNTVKLVLSDLPKGNWRTVAQDRVLLNTGLIIILHHLYLLCTYFLTPCVSCFVLFFLNRKKKSLMRCYYLYLTTYRFTNCQETLRKKETCISLHHVHTIGYIAIHNRVFKNDKTVNKTNFHRNL